MSETTLASRTSLFDKIKSYLSLLAINRQGLRAYFSSPYRIILILLFSVLFLPHVFVVVRDANFVMAYEVDPGSIIESIFSQLSHYYNLNKGYHSSQYGWTYFDINFFLLLPIYILSQLKIIKDDFYFFVAIRFIFFVIGLSSVLAYFEVGRRTLKSNLAAFVASVICIASFTLSRFFYYLHPETTGLLFLCLALLCLLQYHESGADDVRWYVFGLISLVLSTLSKQVFLFTAIPVLFLFIWFYCYHHKIAIPGFIFRKQFWVALGMTAIISSVVFFLVNPYAILQWRVFLSNQQLLYSIVRSSPLTYDEAIRAWIDIVWMLPAIYISIFLAPFSLVGAVILGKNNQAGRMLYIVNLVAAMLFIVIVSVTSRYIISHGYFAPIYPFFVLNLMAISVYVVRNVNLRLLKILLAVVFVSFWFLMGLNDFLLSLPVELARLQYKETLLYKSYDYIQKDVPDGSRVVYDLFVVIPSGKGIVACKSWNECATKDLEGFNPDYVIFSENWTLSGVTTPETARLIKYVRDHHFEFITEISSTSLYTEGDFTVSVWKKPDQ